MAATRHELRLDGYIRVSQVRGRAGESFISPDVQRQRIESWCAAYGHELVHVHEELDESGARSDRPKLLAAIDRIERGEIKGLVVYKADRFGRNLLDGLLQIERIKNAGGQFVAVADGLDTSTDSGKLVLHLMLSLAEHDLDKIRANWQEAKSRAVARGVHPSAVPPFGYRRDGAARRPGGGATGPLFVDPVNGPIVTELFRRRADGAGYAELTRWMEGTGARTQRGRSTWSLRAVKDLIRNEVYLGVAFSRARRGTDGIVRGETFRNENAHPALTDHITFKRAQRPGVQFISKRDPSAIRPLLRCAGCRYKLRSEYRKYKGGDAWLFTCRASGRNDAGQLCDHPATLKETGDVEEWIVDRFVDNLDAHIARLQARTPELDGLRDEVERARGAFEQWRDDDRVQQRLGMDAYIDGLAARQERLNLALAHLARAEAEHDAPIPGIGSAQVRDAWPNLKRDAQADLLQSTIECVMVQRASAGTPLGERLHIVWKGTPIDLPATGYREFVPRPFIPDSVDGNAVGLGMKVE